MLPRRVCVSPTETVAPRGTIVLTNDPLVAPARTVTPLSWRLNVSVPGPPMTVLEISSVLARRVLVMVQLMGVAVEVIVGIVPPVPVTPLVQLKVVVKLLRPGVVASLMATA